jgi:hypothetical protein
MLTTRIKETNDDDPEAFSGPFYLRRIQPAGVMSCAVNLPKNFVRDIGLDVGKYVRFTKEGDRIIITAADVSEKKVRRRLKGTG